MSSRASYKIAAWSPRERDERCLNCNDVNLTVSESLFERYYYHPRFRPSYLQRSMVEGGLLGRKSGRGFYDYGAEKTVENNEMGLSEDVSLRVISCIVNEAFLATQKALPPPKT